MRRLVLLMPFCISCQRRKNIDLIFVFVPGFAVVEALAGTKDRRIPRTCIDWNLYGFVMRFPHARIEYATAPQILGLHSNGLGVEGKTKFEIWDQLFRFKAMRADSSTNCVQKSAGSVQESKTSRGGRGVGQLVKLNTREKAFRIRQRILNPTVE